MEYNEFCLILTTPPTCDDRYSMYMRVCVSGTILNVQGLGVFFISEGRDSPLYLLMNFGSQTLLVIGGAAKRCRLLR